MIPTTIPEHAYRQGLTKEIVGPPEDISEEECGTIEILMGEYLAGAFDGAPAIASYWKPSSEEIDLLLKGGVVEMVLLLPFVPVMQLNAVEK